MFNPRILVTGGRKYTNKKLVWKSLDKLYSSKKWIGVFSVIEGGAMGADRHAQEWAHDAITRGLKVNLITKEADWDTYGNGAGMRRNKEMALLCPDICIAFAGGRGTNNMKNICNKKGIKLVDIKERKIYHS